MVSAVRERVNLHSNLLKNPKTNGVPIGQIKSHSQLLMALFLSFSEIFYVDATSEDTIQTDLEAVAPGNAKRTVKAGLRWLASHIRKTAGSSFHVFRVFEETERRERHKDSTSPQRNVPFS